MSGPDFDEVLANIDRVVRERRDRGEFPIGHEQQLEAGFRDTLSSTHQQDARIEALRAAIATVDVAVHQVEIGSSTSSRVPLGSLVHGAAGRIVSRQTGPLAETIRHLGESIVTALASVEDAVAAQHSADERQLLDVLAGVLDRLSVIDHLVEVVGDLEDRVVALEQRLEPLAPSSD